MGNIESSSRSALISPNPPVYRWNDPTVKFPDSFGAGSCQPKPQTSANSNILAAFRGEVIIRYTCQHSVVVRNIPASFLLWHFSTL